MYQGKCLLLSSTLYVITSQHNFTQLGSGLSMAAFFANDYNSLNMTKGGCPYCVDKKNYKYGWQGTEPPVSLLYRRLNCHVFDGCKCAPLFLNVRAELYENLMNANVILRWFYLFIVSLGAGIRGRRRGTYLLMRCYSLWWRENMSVGGGGLEVNCVK